MIQKGVGVCSSAHPGVVGLRIALSTQDRQRQLAHASTDYIIRYIETHHADASLSSVCCDDWSLRSSLPTTTDALALASELAVRARKRLSHKIRPPAYP